MSKMLSSIIINKIPSWRAHMRSISPPPHPKYRKAPTGNIMENNAEGMKAKLYIGNLPFALKRSELESLFQPYGPFVDFCWSTDRITQAFRGFAFITFENPAKARMARDELKHATLYGREMHLEFASCSHADDSVINTNDISPDGYKKKRFDDRSSPLNDSRSKFSPLTNDPRKSKFSPPIIVEKRNVDPRKSKFSPPIIVEERNVDPRKSKFQTPIIVEERNVDPRKSKFSPPIIVEERNVEHRYPYDSHQPVPIQSESPLYTQSMSNQNYNRHDSHHSSDKKSDPVSIQPESEPSFSSKLDRDDFERIFFTKNEGMKFSREKFEALYQYRNRLLTRPQFESQYQDWIEDGRRGEHTPPPPLSDSEYFNYLDVAFYI